MSPTAANINLQPETPPRDNLEVPEANIFKNRGTEHLTKTNFFYIVISVFRKLEKFLRFLGITPERVEFENTLDLTSEEELLSEIDEDDWTERNFGNSASDYDSTDQESDFRYG